MPESPTKVPCEVSKKKIINKTMELHVYLSIKNKKFWEKNSNFTYQELVIEVIKKSHAIAEMLMISTNHLLFAMTYFFLKKWSFLKSGEIEKRRFPW